MMINWYAFCDDGQMHSLGEHETFDSANDAAEGLVETARAEPTGEYSTIMPLAVVWIMDAVSLRTLKVSIDSLIKE